MEEVNKRRWLGIDIIIVLLVYVILRKLHVANLEYGPIELNRVMSAYLPFFVGVLMRKHSALYTLCVRNIWVYTCLIVAFVCFFSSRYLLDYGSVFVLMYKFAWLILPIAGSLIVFNWFAKGLFPNLSGAFTYIGKYSMPIYLIHFFFIAKLPALGDFLLKQTGSTIVTLQLAYSISHAVVSILIALALYKVLAASPHIRLLLFGER